MKYLADGCHKWQWNNTAFVSRVMFRTPNKYSCISAWSKQLHQYRKAQQRLTSKIDCSLHSLVCSIPRCNIRSTISRTCARPPQTSSLDFATTRRILSQNQTSESSGWSFSFVQQRSREAPPTRPSQQVLQETSRVPQYTFTESFVAVCTSLVCFVYGDGKHRDCATQCRWTLYDLNWWA
jgi:hypothetical protein